MTLRARSPARSILLALLALSLPLAVGCGALSLVAGYDEVTEVRVSPNPAHVEVGGTVQLHARAYNEVGWDLDLAADRFSWFVTSGDSFASVGDRGLVSGLAEGMARVWVTATYLNSWASGSTVVVVGDPDPAALVAVEVSPDHARLWVGETIQLTASAFGYLGESLSLPESSFTWEMASGASFASVDATGMVTALAAGTATVRATEKESGVSGDAEVVVSVTPTIEGHIAFVSDRDGNQEIYVMSSDVSNQVNLTNDPASDHDPCWSPDGSNIAFTSDRDGNYEIYVMNADGTTQTRVTNNPRSDEQPSWSPDGSKIAFCSYRDGNNEIYVMNSDGSNQTNLTKNPRSDQGPCWSADGSKIAFVSDRDGSNEIYVMNSDGSNQTNLTNNPAWDSDPSWSPDGSRIAFASNRGGASYWDFEIYVMNSDGSNQTNLTTLGGEHPCWSPDGSKIAFALVQIYVMNSDGSNRTRLTNNTTAARYPTWSPDGRKIAFHFYHREAPTYNYNYEIYVINSDGTNQTNLTNNPADDKYPSWSPS